MTALDHATRWLHGELFEGGATLAFGLLLVGASAAVWKFGVSPAARAMVIPLLLLGGTMAAVCAVIEVQNMHRIEAFRQAHALDPAAFLHSEIERVQGFMGWYRYTFAGGALFVVAGLAVFLWRGEPLARAIGLTALILGATALHFDFFSESRARRYLADLNAVAREAPGDLAPAEDRTRP